MQNKVTDADIETAYKIETEIRDANEYMPGIDDIEISDVTVSNILSNFRAKHYNKGFDEGIKSSPLFHQRMENERLQKRLDNLVEIADTLNNRMTEFYKNGGKTWKEFMDENIVMLLALESSILNEKEGKKNGE